MTKSAEWAARLDAWRASGKNASDFCAEHGYSAKKLVWWSSHFRRKTEPTAARLHGLDPEEYLRCVIRLVPLWPDDRMLELAPPFWARTRDRLDAAELEKEIGWIRSRPGLST
jgi:hypothetical protein